jgi:hypothetical protein
MKPPKNTWAEFETSLQRVSMSHDGHSKKRYSKNRPSAEILSQDTRHMSATYVHTYAYTHTHKAQNFETKIFMYAGARLCGKVWGTWTYIHRNIGMYVGTYVHPRVWSRLEIRKMWMYLGEQYTIIQTAIGKEEI